MLNVKLSVAAELSTEVAVMVGVACPAPVGTVNGGVYVIVDETKVPFPVGIGADSVPHVGCGQVTKEPPC